MNMPTESKKLQKLRKEAAEATQLRGLQIHPDVIALRIERIRSWVDRLMWTGLVLGLLFTMTNVQKFAANGAAKWSTEWWIAWLLDPMVSLVLIAILLAEAVLSRWQIKAGRWVRTAKWGLLAATGAMNTWEAWIKGAPSEILQHVVPVALVFFAAEAITDLREKLSDAVTKAYTAAAARAAEAGATAPFVNDSNGVRHPEPAPVQEPVREPAQEPVHEATPKIAGEHPRLSLVNAATNTAVNAAPAMVTEVHEHRVHEAPAAPTARKPKAATNGKRAKSPKSSKSAASPTSRRKLFGEYLAEARAALEADPNAVVTPAWVRDVTDCSRGLSSKLAGALQAAA